MPSCCLTKEACLRERSKALMVNGPTGWDNKCMDCAVGMARQMIDFVPEPGFGPNCIVCGYPIASRNSSTKANGKIYMKTGLCMECGKRGKSNKGNQAKRGGVKAYWGYREKAHEIVEYRKAKGRTA